MSARSRIGVLALQGAFAAHTVALTRLGVESREVRLSGDLGECDALVMPGGESTTMSKLLETSALFDPIAERIADGMPVFGTCAGMILLAREVTDGRPDQRSFGAIDIAVQRNAYGRQVDSFETDIALRGDAEPFHAVFIARRASPGSVSGLKCSPSSRVIRCSYALTPSWRRRSTQSWRTMTACISCF